MPSGYFGGFAICGLFTCGRGRDGLGVADRIVSFAAGATRGIDAASELRRGFP